MADNSTPDYRSLFLQAEERRKQAEEKQQQAEERIRQTTFLEVVRYSHDLLSRPLRVETPSRSTTGKIPPPTGKYCPTRLEYWKNCPTQLSQLYTSVCRHLDLGSGDTPRLFPPLLELEGIQRRLDRPLSCEEEVRHYERLAVEDHVRDIITELSKLPAARNEFGLGDAIQFSSHTNALNDTEASRVAASQTTSTPQPKADQYCIHRVDGNVHSVLTSVEYKPPHKLPVASLRVGLHPMDLWKAMVKCNKIVTDEESKLRYNAERLACSAIVQEYHVMIQDGLEYSYVTNGISRVLLRVPQDNPSTLYYFFCDPNSEVDLEADYDSRLLRTSVARTLCLCLLAFRSPTRSQEWRESARKDLGVWTTSFDHTYSQIPKEERQKTVPHSDSTAPEFSSPSSGSPYVPSSPPESPTASGRGVATRSQPSCAPPRAQRRSQSPDSSGSDTNHAMGQKRRFSQVSPSSSPSAQRAARQQGTSNDQDSQSRRRAAQFCTQRCLLGLQTGGILDDCCPNVMLHRQTDNELQHPTTSEGLVDSLKAQFDENIDRCIPFGNCGAYGAPFKLTCATYGYTVIGKGTTSGLWEEVSREAQVYQLLRRAQASAVPVFLGTIDLAKTYFLHGAGAIRHMLVMGWGGESSSTMELEPWLLQEIHRSRKEIKALGIIHKDLRRDNILWNKELQRALIIDFHRSTLRSRPSSQRQKTAKRRLCQVESGDVQRLRVL
ncbi:hypothetical protein BDV25DRAFT_157615 [Aspergillus avenaceus]|uniref:Protein kinase domain-containing protein n=1 Tax=Aspergillus avenaceus TaxID=36643 RepID=A0A5N6TR18_ASPAV|nr:hypothetical protein BDV25DRAFT_157615 [Aspergillus avenaceus]